MLDDELPTGLEETKVVLSEPTDNPIAAALKSQGAGVSLRNDYKRMIWEDGLWVVYERQPHQRQSRKLVETSDEGEAVKVLLADG